MDYAPTASFELLLKAYQEARKNGINTHVGSILSSDTFYEDDPQGWRKWADFGILAAEMESAGLYTLAAKFKVRALSILTVSDSIVKGEAASAEQREKGFTKMTEIASKSYPDTGIKNAFAGCPHRILNRDHFQNSRGCRVYRHLFSVFKDL